MDKKIDVIPDDQLLELVIRAARGFEYENPELGWDIRWIGELFTKDISEVGVITPNTMRKAMHLIVRSRREHLRGMRACKEGLTLKDCPHPPIIAGLDHFVEFDAVNWRAGWKASALKGANNFTDSTRVSSQTTSASPGLNVIFSEAFSAVAGRLSAQYEGFEASLAQSIGSLVFDVSRKKLRKSSKDKTHFLYPGVGMPTVKLIYRIDDVSLYFVALDLQGMQPPML